MQLTQRFMSVFGSLAFIAVLLFSTSSVSAATKSSGLSAAVGRPGTSWSDKLTASPGETVNLLITYTNEHKFVGQKFVIIKDTLPAGAVFKSASAYLFTPAAPQGVQQPDTLTTTGISTGPLKAGETAFIQFQMILPPASSVGCGRNALTNRVDAASRTGNKTYAASTKIVVKRDCTVTPTVTSTPTTPTTPTTTTPTPVSVVAVDASVNTVNNTTNNYDTPAPTQVASANTATTPSNVVQTQPVAAKDDNSAKTLVNSGPGSILLIALVATVVGAIGSRLVLYRLLGA